MGSLQRTRERKATPGSGGYGCSPERPGRGAEGLVAGCRTESSVVEVIPMGEVVEVSLPLKECRTQLKLPNRRLYVNRMSWWCGRARSATASPIPIRQKNYKNNKLASIKRRSTKPKI